MRVTDALIWHSFLLQLISVNMWLLTIMCSVSILCNALMTLGEWRKYNKSISFASFNVLHILNIMLHITNVCMEYNYPRHRQKYFSICILEYFFVFLQTYLWNILSHELQIYLSICILCFQTTHFDICIPEYFFGHLCPALSTHPHGLQRAAKLDVILASDSISPCSLKHTFM